MHKLVRRSLLVTLFVLVLLLLVGVTTVLADGYHWVRSGETLFSIGRLYGVNPYYIAQVNRLPNPNYIQIGQVLYIPGPGGWAPPPRQPRYPPNCGWYRPCWCYPYYGWNCWGWGWGWDP